MTGNVENLILEHLERVQALLDRVDQRVSDLCVRAANLVSGQDASLQHLGQRLAVKAAQQSAIDHINGRLDRIERRLELAS